MKIILIKIIRFYQKYLSALKGRATCIYTPTCSQYAIEAIEKHGVLKGGLLAAWRILRCNPFSKGGYDPVCHGIHFLLSEFHRHSEHWIMYHHIYHYCSIINAASDY